MRNWFIALGVFVLSATTLAQESTEQEAINKDVWYNFMQAYQDLDAGLFLKLHSAENLLIDTARVRSASLDDCLEVFNLWNQQEVQQKIEFRFLNREQRGDWAYETGIFKLTRYQKDQAQFYYGRFDIGLRKVAGIWKIHFDPETDRLETVIEQEFDQGQVLNY